MSRLTSIFEVRLKNNGRVFSRHYEAQKPAQAAKRANGQGRILGIRKVRPEDIIGNLENMVLDPTKGPMEKSLMETETLESILFPRNKSKGRFSDAKRNTKDKEREAED